MKSILLFCLLMASAVSAKSKPFVLVENGKASPVFLTCPTSPVQQAAKLLVGDIQTVTGITPVVNENRISLKKRPFAVVVGIPGTSKLFDSILKKNKINVSSLIGTWEAYRLQVVKSGKNSLMLVIGSDDLGTAYGLLEISRRIGVSPWVWWADAAPLKKTSLTFPADFRFEDKPSVRYRGIFLNDEDFSLMPWATETLDPKSAKGAIGPLAYERIFQLLLRLRANVIWPAMHNCTVAFYAVPGNAEMAAKYGINVATSHCEPLMRNNVGEWNEATMGDYDYTVNAEKVKKYWTDRVLATKGTPCVYTVGMRGIHDGKMEGANSLTEQRDLLEKVFIDQRQILSDALRKPINKIPQVFIPYKEVLDVYDSGLKVPDDVTMMWCDDNYGNITRFSNAEEQKRSGGAGIYYHLSYWGRPHDYLWLASTSPAKIQFEMTRAWEQNAREIWVVNVGDIKPAEYLSEYFLDLAWNIGKKAKPVIKSQEPEYADHLQAFMQREFGAEYAVRLSHIMQTYYHLANQRKPEFMGWSRVEEAGAPAGKTPVMDTEFSQQEAEARIQAYANIEGQVRSINESLSGASRTSFFQLVLYPVVGASMLNQKLLYAQLSRQAEADNLPETAAKYAAASLFAYQEIKKLTELYNSEIANGKWAKFMNDHPRDLNVFREPLLPERLKNCAPKSILHTSVVLRDATTKDDYLQEIDQRVSFPASIARPEARPSGLGHSLSAIHLKKGETLDYSFTTTSSGEAELCICTLPNYALDGGALRYEVILNEGSPIKINTETNGRSEAWKLRVLRNQSVVRIKLSELKPGIQKLKLIALDDDVMPDQIMLDFNLARNTYLLPGIPLVQ